VTDRTPRGLEGATLVQGAGRRGGNVLYRVETAQGPLLLKLYRQRRGAVHEAFQALSHRVFEGKRGVSAKARFETEAESLARWSAAGFRVPKTFDLPLPEGVEGPALYLELIEGQLLSTILEAADVPFEEKERLVRRVFEEVGRRHALAVQDNDSLLIQEHATTNHVFIRADGTHCTFDLEGAFQEGFPVIEAIAQELAGYLRALAKRTGEAFPAILDALIDAHGHKDLLAQAARRGVEGGGIARKLKRMQDRRRRKSFGKTDLLGQLLSALETG
jgi:tRNA A-37 threonylcarbamoyl transferase component Bud32